MRRRLTGGLSLVAIAAAIAGCDLEFVDVNLEERAQLGLRIYTYTDQDSIRINGGFSRGFDERGQRRSVIAGLQIDDVVLPPDMAVESGWAWNRSVSGGLAADGRLEIHPPILEGIGVPQPVEVDLPDRVGDGLLEIPPGDPILLRYVQPAATKHWGWTVRLLDADGHVHFTAQSSNSLSGEFVIPGALLPSNARGPYRAELEILAETPHELETAEYGVRIQTISRLKWVIVRPER